jgi:hypothetical protein
MKQWTQESYEDLSSKVANKFGIEKVRYEIVDAYCRGSGISHRGKAVPTFKYKEIWLHNDWAQIMPLCNQHRIYCDNAGDDVMCFFATGDVSFHNSADHELAERVARLLALLEVSTKDNPNE